MHDAIHKYVAFIPNVGIQCQALDPIPNFVFKASLHCLLGIHWIFWDKISIQLKIKVLYFDIYRIIKPVGEAKSQSDKLNFHEALSAIINMKIMRQSLALLPGKRQKVKLQFLSI